MENDLSMSMLANKADYWKARAEAEEDRANSLRESLAYERTMLAKSDERIKELEDMLKYAAGKLDDWGAYSQAMKVRSVFKENENE